MATISDIVQSRLAAPPLFTTGPGLFPELAGCSPPPRCDSSQDVARVPGRPRSTGMQVSTDFQPDLP